MEDVFTRNDEIYDELIREDEELAEDEPGDETEKEIALHCDQFEQMLEDAIEARTEIDEMNESLSSRMKRLWQ